MRKTTFNRLKNACLLLSLGLTSFSAFALPETEVFSTMTGLFQEGHYCEKQTDQKFWKRVVVKTPLKAYQKKSGTYRLRYSKYGCSVGDKGSLVIGPGRSEGSMEYYETAIDYIKMGFSPVYVIDHRGQGLSPRRLKNNYKGHVEDFMNYVSDLDFAVEDILKDLKAQGRDAKKNPLFYSSNSMGGGIGLTYFQVKGKNNPFKAAALFGSMIRVNYLSFIGAKPTFLNNKIYSEFGVIAQGRQACLRGKCNEYTRPKVFGDYRPGTRNFVELDSVKEMEKYMTHSKARYDMRTFLWDKFDWSKIIEEEYKGENWSGPELGGATFSWALTTTKGLKKLRRVKSIKKLSSMPILIVTGSRDLRAYKPFMDGSTDLSYHKGFCDKVNKYNRFKNKKLCSFSPLKDGFHEIYKDSDSFRSDALSRAESFFLNSSK